MKEMKDMNRDELIELVASVSLRLYGFDFAINAFLHLFHLRHYLSMPPASSYAVNSYIEDIAFDAVMTLVMFFLTVPLARLLCRGVSHALELKPLN
jgi:hypothetical protein